MTEANRHPLLQDTLLANLQRWCQGLPLVTAHAAPKIQQLLESQTLIGWRNLMEGLPSCWIRRIQQKHILQNQLRSSGKKWTQQFLTKVFFLAPSMWEHHNTIKHRSKRPGICACYSNSTTVLLQNCWQVPGHCLLLTDITSNSTCQTSLTSPHNTRRTGYSMSLQPDKGIRDNRLTLKAFKLFP